MRNKQRPGASLWRNKKSWLLLAVGCGLLAFGGVGLWQAYRATHSSKPLPAGNPTITTSAGEPDETPPDPNSDYQVPAGQPRRIMLPSISAEGFIQRVGIDQKNAVAVPNNVHMAGWFIGESVPGAPGLSIIDGHVQGRYAAGIFKNLGTLQPGDSFSVEFGDRSTKQFEVVSVHSYPVGQAAGHLFEKQAGISSQLNLITCGGTYNRQSRQYDERIIVVSKLQEQAR